MQSLPRTVREVWFSTGLLWLMACAATWWLLPVAPHAILRLSEGDTLLGFSPSGTIALIASAEPVSVSARVDLLDVKSGRICGRLLNRTSRLSVAAHSADNRIWLFRSFPSPFLKVDLVTQTVEALAISDSEAAGFAVESFSDDGRFCVFRTATAPNQVVIWDIANNQSHARLPAKENRTKFMVSSHRLAAVDLDANQVRVFDAETIKPLATLTIPRQIEPVDSDIQVGVWISLDEGYVATSLVSWTHAREIIAWEIATEKMIKQSGSLNFPKLANEHALVVPMDRMGGCILQRLDLASGEYNFNVAIHRGDFDISPDGRTLLAICEEPDEGLMEHFALKLGLSWPFSPRICRRARLHDSTTGESIGSALGDRYESGGSIYNQKDFLWLPSGQGVAMHDFQSNAWQIWDIPPRKSLSQFALWSLVLAVAMAYFGWISGRLMRVRWKNRQSPSDSVPINTASPSRAAP